MTSLNWGWEFDPDPTWGGGLQAPDNRFPLGAEVAITKTGSFQSTVGYYELVVAEEVGRVTREGSHRILIRMERRRKPVSIYLPTDVLERMEKT